MLRMVSASDGNTAKVQQADNAIRLMGTNALPSLLEWLHYDTPDRLLLSRALRWLRLPPSTWLGHPRLAMPLHGRDSVIAAYGFDILGPAAAPAFPQVSSMVNDPKATQMAISVLASFGTQSLPALMNAATNHPNALNRAYAVDRIGDLVQGGLGTNADEVVAALLHCLRAPDRYVASRAAAVLGKMALSPETVVPELIACLDDADSRVRCAAVEALAGFGNKASPAIPRLRAALADSDADVRREATNALQKVSHDAQN
jgi:hypothetical protein